MSKLHIIDKGNKDIYWTPPTNKLPLMFYILMFLAKTNNSKSSVIVTINIATRLSLSYDFNCCNLGAQLIGAAIS